MEEKLPVRQNKDFIAFSHQYVLSAKEGFSELINNVFKVMLTHIVMNKNVDQVIVPVKELSDVMGIEINNMERLSLVLKLMNKALIFDKEDPDKPGWGNILDKVNFEPGDTDICFTLATLGKKLFIYLGSNNPYARQYIKSGIQHSTAAQFVFDILSIARTRRDKSLTVDYLLMRAALGLKEDQYKLFSDFRKNILELAERHIMGLDKHGHPNTGYTYKWELKKKGKSVVAIKFTVLSVADYEIPPRELKEMERKKRVPLNTPAQEKEMIKSMKEKFSFPNILIQRFAKKLPRDEYFKFLVRYQSLLGTKSQITDPGKAMTDLCYKLEEKRKAKEHIEKELGLNPDQIAEVISQEPLQPLTDEEQRILYRVNISSQQDEMRRTLSNKKIWDFTPEQINQMCLEYPYDKYKTKLYNLKMRFNNGKGSNDPIGELWRDFEENREK